MSLISLVIVLIVVGVLLWAANTYIPMDSKIKSIMNIVVVIAVVLWLLSAFGVLLWLLLWRLLHLRRVLLVLRLLLQRLRLHL